MEIVCLNFCFQVCAKVERSTATHTHTYIYKLEWRSFMTRLTDFLLCVVLFEVTQLTAWCLNPLFSAFFLFKNKILVVFLNNKKIIGMNTLRLLISSFVLTYSNESKRFEGFSDMKYILLIQQELKAQLDLCQ